MTDTGNRLPLIGEEAPAFEAETTQGHLSFPQDFEGRWVVFFSHPADFTPVCTTEFLTFASMQEEFRALNCELLGLSIDSTFSHIAWLRTIKEKVEFRGMKDVEVMFPVISDLTMDVARKYGMLQPAASTTQAVRAVFVIDPKAKVRLILYYPMAVGRNLAEIKRLLIALQTSDTYGIATPANWTPGEEVILPPPGSCGAARDRVNSPDPGVRCVDWFLCFKKLPEGETAAANK